MGEAARRKALGAYPGKNDNTRIQRSAIRAAAEAELAENAAAMPSLSPEEKARIAGIRLVRPARRFR